MKFKIRYEFDANYGISAPYWAIWNGMYKCGKSYAEARAALMKELRAIAEHAEPEVTPDPEEVEL